MSEDKDISESGWLRRLAERLKPAAKARTHLLAAASLWTVVGLGLLTLGLIWCFAVRLPWPFVLAVLGIAAGSLKGRFVLRRLAEKNAARVVRRGDGHCLGGFLSVKTWLLVAVMMTSGILLRRSGVPHPILGVLYSAIGTALLAGSIPLWKARRQLGGEDPFRRAPGRPGRPASPSRAGHETPPCDQGGDSPLEPSTSGSPGQDPEHIAARQLGGEDPFRRAPGRSGA